VDAGFPCDNTSAMAAVITGTTNLLSCTAMAFGWERMRKSTGKFSQDSTVKTSPGTSAIQVYNLTAVPANHSHTIMQLT
jgi:hypothetical protein